MSTKKSTFDSKGYLKHLEVFTLGRKLSIFEKFALFYELKPASSGFERDIGRVVGYISDREFDGLSAIYHQKDEGLRLIRLRYNVIWHLRAKDEYNRML